MVWLIIFSLIVLVVRWLTHESGEMKSYDEERDEFLEGFGIKD